MAEEVEMTPVEPVEPPKVNPLGSPVSVGPKTVKMAPIIRKPTTGVTQSTLKAGLKLPPKPAGMATAGLKLPTQTAAFKPGLKLPPKPVIRKPGSTVMAKPLPKPVVSAAASAAKPAEAAAKPVAPAAVAAPAPAAEAPKPMEALKSVTQKLKGITQQIPQQAILRKTGIIADETMSDAQKQAAKSKTARISLSEAMGVSPVKEDNAPLKTIRIKRPVDIGGAAAAPAGGAATESAAASGAGAAAEQAKEAASTITQRKTLKISRPGGGAVRPTGKFGIKRPSQATTIAKQESAADGSKPETVAEVADIADIPEMPMPNVPKAVAQDDSPAWLNALSSIVQAAACVGMAGLAWLLYQGTQTMFF